MKWFKDKTKIMIKSLKKCGVNFSKFRHLISNLSGQSESICLMNYISKFKDNLTIDYVEIEISQR